MEVTLLRDDEHVVRFNDKPFGDKFDRHVGEAREDLVQHGGERPHVIDDDDGDTHVRWEVPKQSCVGVEAAGRTADADDGERPSRSASLCQESLRQR